MTDDVALTLLRGHASDPPNAAVGSHDRCSRSRERLPNDARDAAIDRSPEAGDADRREATDRRPVAELTELVQAPALDPTPAREHRPAVVILDWEMPVYTGLELTAVIKGDPLLRETTVIMLTGRVSRADREAGARAQADVYLVKPFSLQELLTAVEQALGIP